MFTVYVFKPRDAVPFNFSTVPLLMGSASLQSHRKCGAENVALFLLRLRLGLCPGPRWGTHDAPQTLYSAGDTPSPHSTPSASAAPRSTFAPSALVTRRLDHRTFGARHSRQSATLHCFLTNRTLVSVSLNHHHFRYIFVFGTLL